MEKHTGFKKYVETSYPIEDYIKKSAEQSKGLKAYQDTGLTPEQIQTLQQEIDRLKHNIDNHIRWNEEHVKARVEQSLDYKAWAEDNIGKIDALLGGKEDV